ncbi:MAG: hypothetical protein DHS20C17_06510 [Cyclobacteriaceae bacterium]|nr:MAG: hypothetical protein DHS20C17_06510 [Cyclobacteriaceae bacterium]
MRITRGIIAQLKPISNIPLLVFVGLTGCTMLGPSTSSTTHSEDLSAYRPKVELDQEVVPETSEEQTLSEVNPENHQTNEVEQKLEEISRFNKTSRTAPGFTIQVYSGTSREQASQAKTQVYRILPDSRPETKYEQPIYRVRVGAFGDRLEAQNTYAQLQKEFPQAIVIPSRIKIN